MVDTFRTNVQCIVDDIHSEIDFLNETDRLFPRELGPPIRPFETLCQNEETALPENESIFRLTTPTPIVDHQPARPIDDEAGWSVDDLPTISVETICDCFEPLCFGSHCFDPTPFDFLSRTVFRGDDRDSSERKDNLDKFKGKIVSTLLRKVFVKLSLTKNQMDSLNRIIKAILVFLSFKYQLIKTGPLGLFVMPSRVNKKRRRNETRRWTIVSFLLFLFVGFWHGSLWTRACHILHCEVHLSRKDDPVSTVFKRLFRIVRGRIGKLYFSETQRHARSLSKTELCFNWWGK